MRFPWACSIFSILGRFLEDEYSDYCVPSSVSSGLGSLPLSYVWYKLKENKSWPTDPTLPSDESLNGPYSYSLIMPYFTTNTMTPAEVHELGKTQLNKLYPMVSQRPTCIICSELTWCSPFKRPWKVCCDRNGFIHSGRTRGSKTSGLDLSLIQRSGFYQMLFYLYNLNLDKCNVFESLTNHWMFF